MSVPRGLGQNGIAYHTNITQPVDINMSFIVDSTNTAGVRSLKSNGYVKSVTMNSAVFPATSPVLGTARSYGILGASAVTNTGSSVLTGNLGLYPGTAITGFPPGTVSGTVNATNAAALIAQNTALAAYTEMQARSATTIATALDAQTLVPGVYSAASGTFTLAQSANGTLTLNGNGVYIFKMATTLTTGAGGIPTITLTGGALAKNVYWVVGSSATINSGNAGTFQGNIIALTSVTDTLGGTVNGSLIALNGAVTISAAATLNVQTGSTAGSPSQGTALIRFNNNFNKYINEFTGFISQNSGTSLTSTTAGNPYVITSVGTTTAAQWLTAGVPAGFTPAVGTSFISATTGALGGTGTVQAPSISGALSVEVVGDPDQTISNSNVALNDGASLLVQFLGPSGLAAPADGSICRMCVRFDGSSVTIDGL